MLSNDDLAKYRLESLKMAYEINFKILDMKDSYNKDKIQVIEDLKDVDIFTLADLNFHYIINGTHPSDSFLNEEENNETI